MYYGVYKTARDGAWQCLLDHRITALPVPLKQIARNAGIKLVANSAVNLLSPTERGYAENVKGKWYIVFNDDDTPQAIRFTVAHELGHIFLGHALEKGYARSKRFIVKPQTETEADVFASRLLCPAVVLWGLNLHTADEIAAACNVSQAAARIRADRMRELYRRDKFLTSPLERAVFENFRDYITNKRGNSE